jgi:acetyltransferase-like isoleucine patch superfamily enzyme
MNKLKHLFIRLTEDNGSWWSYRFYQYRLKYIKYFSGKIVKVSFFFKGIKTNSGCEYFGVPYFYREPLSRIIIGKNCRFRSDHISNLIGVNHRCMLSTHHPDALIVIGDNCGFSGATIGAASEIIIGNNVLVGANAIITDFDWHSDLSNTVPQPIIIHNNVWIGVNVTVLKGVTIGENSIIGAHSLVVKDIPANVIAGGNPCKVLKNKSSFNE